MPKSWRCAITAAAVAALLLAAGGCSEDDPAEPTSPDSADLALSAAVLSVDGHDLDGQAIHRGDDAGPVLYAATLLDGHGRPVPGGQVQVRYGMEMMQHMRGYMHLGELSCYDDGTHGDPTPGDGTYCFLDSGNEHGCHRAGAQPGQYRYEFCGYDAQGHASNRLDVNVSLLP